MVRHSEETSGAKVDTCIKVFNRKADNSQRRNLKFVVKIYHTSSTMVVNGSKVDLYLADIHELLCDKLSKTGHMLTSLNDNITSTISKFISTVPNLNQKLATANTNWQDNMDDLAITFRTDESKDLNEDTSDICPICNTISLLETIECSECSLWIHNECAGLSQSAVSALNSLDFLRHQNEQLEGPSCSTNCTQQPSTSSHPNSNHHNNNTDEQRLRMIEMQMMQNMSMNNMLANQQMPIMMQQQQMVQQQQMMQQQQMIQQQQLMQQPPLQPNHGFSMYPHMIIPRHVPPPPDFVQMFMLE
ncbi:unnamed protein product [Mytilus coruscus]|uniref:Uncharacterized protein n=1 Tax=Mytilus coruscus TaxID=42192 RepID=A0A6J8AD70_MYTCO|nr:unnamed protein product [Mytilus coruscus]